MGFPVTGTAKYLSAVALPGGALKRLEACACFSVEAIRCRNAGRGHGVLKVPTDRGYASCQAS